MCLLRQHDIKDWHWNWILHHWKCPTPNLKQFLQNWLSFTGGQGVPPWGSPLPRLPPEIWSENNRKINVIKEICVTIDSAPQTKIPGRKPEKMWEELGFKQTLSQQQTLYFRPSNFWLTAPVKMIWTFSKRQCKDLSKTYIFDILWLMVFTLWR